MNEYDEKCYYLVLDTQNGTQLYNNQANFSWNLDRALPKGSKVCLYQFNFTTSSATGFSSTEINGVLIESTQIGNKFKSYVSKSSDKPVQTCILGCIPNETIFNSNGTEKIAGTYEPYNLVNIQLPEHQEIYELELSLKDPDGNSKLTLDDDLDWAVVLKITLP